MATPDTAPGEDHEDTMRLRLMRGGVALVLTLLLAVPASATPPPELDAAREELEGARQSLAEVERAVDRAKAQVDAADAQLSQASARLRDLSGELRDAELALATASDAQLVVAAELADALERLDTHQAAWEVSRASVNDRVAEVYKRGAGAPTGMIVAGVSRAGDLHEAAVAVRTVTGMLERDRDLMEQNRGLTLAANAARAVVDARRDAARATERDAARERQRIELVLREQAQLVSQVQSARDLRADALTSLEGDRAAGAVLVQRLAQQVRDLALSLDEVLLASVDIPIDAPAPAWAVALPARGRPWAASINVAAGREGLDPRLLAAVVWTESNFTPTAVSHAGAIGLTQLMPGTAAGLAVDPWDPMQNLQGGARYLRGQVGRFGTVELGLAAYNAGPGAVSRAGGIPDYRETQLYVVRVLERYERIRTAG